MNLIEFLKEVDNFCDNHSNDNLKFALHNIARKVPEEQRQNFLKIIKDESKKTENSLFTAELKQEVDTVKQELENLDSDDVYLVEEYNYEYNDWYNSDVDEFYYEDPQGITNIIQKAALVVNQLMDIEEFKVCFELVKTLIQVEVPTMSEYGGDSNYFDLEEIIDSISMNLNLSDLILKAAYSCYMTVPEELRAEEILDIVLRFDSDNFSFQNLFQFGSELDNINQFLRDCIQNLSKAQTRNEKALLEEAVMLVGDSELEIKVAFDNLNNQPELIYNILTKNSSIPIEEKMNLGFEALELMDNNNVRSEIALFLATCILKTGIDKSKLNYCYFESFRSVPNATNLLRLLLNSSEPLEKLMLKIKAVIVNYKNNSFQDYYLFRNSSSRYSNLLYFLCGEFDFVLNNVMKSEPLGWTSTFMKIAIPMFCFLIYDDSNLPRVFRNQLSQIQSNFGFTNSNYINGLDMKVEDNLFINVLIKWKKLFIVKPEFKSIILDQLDQLIIKRVDAIMEKNRTNYYYECAEYIADIGEANCVIDPNFDYRAYLEKFISMYPRRRNFIRDLKTFM